MKIKNEFECNCKVARAASRADLEGVDEWIEASWRGVGTEKQSLREITDEFNTRVLKGILKQRDTQFMPSQAGFLREVIESDEKASDIDISRVEREEILAELEADGLGADETSNLLISYQTLHTHLKEHLSVSTPTQTKSREETVESQRDTIWRLNSRTEAIAKSFIDKDVDTEDVDTDRFDITATATIRCDQCGYNKRVTQFLADGGCDCLDVAFESADEMGSESADEKEGGEPDSRTDTDGPSGFQLSGSQEEIGHFVEN